MSFETTLARAELRYWEGEWKRHCLMCPSCSVKTGAGRDCAAGTETLSEVRQARAELAENRRLDKQPVPGQGALL